MNRYMIGTLLAAVALTIGMVASRGGANGDFNGNGQVDVLDYSFFATLCFSGPDEPLWCDLCAPVFDFDEDEDVDLRDFASFQRLFTGP